MNTFLRFTSIVLLLFTAALVSCKKNTDLEGKEQEEFKSNDAAHIVAQFAEWDENGNLLFRTKGYTLNEADDTEVTLCVDTWEKSLSLFKEWMPDDADYSETATSLTWKMSDGYGKSQGQAVLNKAADGTMVAEAKLPSDLPFVRTIRFIPKDKWPENSVMVPPHVFTDQISASQLLEPYFFGNTVQIDEPNHHGTGLFVVMREFDNETNEKGLLMRLPKGHKYNAFEEWANIFSDNWEKIKSRVSKVGVVTTLVGIYRDNRDFWDPIMDEADFDTRDYTYFCWDGGWSFLKGYQYKKINFIKGDLENLNEAHPNMRECWAYYFWVEEDKNGVLQLIIK